MEFLQKSKILNLFNQFPYMEFDNYIITEIKEYDYENIIKIYDNKSLYLYNSVTHIRNKDSAIGFIRAMEYKYNLRKEINWIIKSKENGESLGIITLNDICIVDKKAEIGYLVREDRCSRGIITEVLKDLIKILFNRFEFIRIEANVYIDNIPSIRVCNKVGFKNEGLRRKFTFNINTNKYMDSYVFAVTN